MFFEQYTPRAGDRGRPLPRGLLRRRGAPRRDDRAAARRRGTARSNRWSAPRRHPYFVGDSLTLADIALYAYTHVAHEGGFDLEGYPAIRAWLDRVAARAGARPDRCLRSGSGMRSPHLRCGRDTSCAGDEPFASASRRARPARSTSATRSPRSPTGALPTSTAVRSCSGSTTPTRRASSPGGEEAILDDLALARGRLGRRPGAPERAWRPLRGRGGAAERRAAPCGTSTARFGSAASRCCGRTAPRRTSSRPSPTTSTSGSPTSSAAPTIGRTRSSQRRIARALGGELPEVIHHGLLLGEDGKKLSKRHGHASVADLRDEGIPPRRVRAYLEELGLPRHDVHLDRARLGRLAIDAIAAMPDEELAAAAGAPVRLRARCAARARSSRRARSRSRSTPGSVALAERGAADARAVRRAPRRARATLDEADARAIVRELKAVGGDLRALRLALTGPSAAPSSGRSSRRWPPTRRSRARSSRLQLSVRPRRAAAVYDRRMRLQDTLTRHARRAAGAARADRDLRLRADRVPAGAHRQRAAVRRLHVARALAPGARARGAARPQHHGRQRQDLRGRAGRAAPSGPLEATALVPRGHGAASGSGCPTRSRSRPRRSPRSSR